MESLMFNFFSKKIEKKEKTMFLFVGRNQQVETLLELYQSNDYIKKNYNLNILSPEIEWYPKPNGITDQKSSVEKLENTINEVNGLICSITSSDNLNPNQVYLSGFSAGGAVALGLITNYKYKAAISHSGTILNTNSIGHSKHKNPILLIHCRDDSIFNWEERYMPTKNTLLRQNYNVSVVEKNSGGHVISKEDVDYASVFLNQI